MAEITYAKVDGPPDDWWGLKVFDLETGEEVPDVIEANATEGWLVRLARNGAGEIYLIDREAATERLEGRFEIRRGDA